MQTLPYMTFYINIVPPQTQKVQLVRTAGGAEPGRLQKPGREAAEGVAAPAVLLHQDHARGR